MEAQYNNRRIQAVQKIWRHNKQLIQNHHFVYPYFERQNKIIETFSTLLKGKKLTMREVAHRGFAEC